MVQEILAVVVFVCVVMTGSVISAIFFESKTPEKYIPITCSSVVGILFVFGIFQHLREGFYFVCLFCLVSYFLAAYFTIKYKNFQIVRRRLFSFGVYFYLGMIILSALLSYGLLLHVWDEFSHWGDVVKVMYDLDDFATNPKSYSVCQSYPPGMALFQYFAAKLFSMICSSGFLEWVLYFAYQILSYTFLIPFLPDFACFENDYLIKKIGLSTLVFTVVFISPMSRFSNFHSLIYIDTFLGILLAVGILAIVIEEGKKYRHILRLLILMMLVLTKDAGLLFAIILGIAYCADDIRCAGNHTYQKYRSTLMSCLSVFAVIAVTKWLWMYNIQINNARVIFSQPYDLGILWKVIRGNDFSYRAIVLKNFTQTIIPHMICFFGISLALWIATKYQNKYKISNKSVLFVSVLGIFAMCIGQQFSWPSFTSTDYRFLGVFLAAWGIFRYENKYKGRLGSRNSIFIASIMGIFVIYSWGIGLSYMFKFFPYEAVRLASFNRYMDVVYLAVCVVGIIYICHILWEEMRISKKWKDWKNSFMFSVVMILCVAVIVHLGYTQGQFKIQANVIRQKYTRFSDDIDQFALKDDNILIVSQGDKGFDYYVLKYLLRPVHATLLHSKSGIPLGWSFGKPLYEGDIWTIDYSPAEFQQKLIDNDIKYICLYKVDRTFAENYKSVFEHQNKIKSGKIFYFNKESERAECLQINK